MGLHDAEQFLEKNAESTYPEKTYAKVIIEDPLAHAQK
jgi:hypothetical protein